MSTNVPDSLHSSKQVRLADPWQHSRGLFFRGIMRCIFDRNAIVYTIENGQQFRFDLAPARCSPIGGPSAGGTA